MNIDVTKDSIQSTFAHALAHPQSSCHSKQYTANNIQGMSFIEIHTMISIHHKLNFNHLFSLFDVSIHKIYKISIVMIIKHIYYSLFILIIK